MHAFTHYQTHACDHALSVRQRNACTTTPHVNVNAATWSITVQLKVLAAQPKHGSIAKHLQYREPLAVPRNAGNTRNAGSTEKHRQFRETPVPADISIENTSAPNRQKNRNTSNNTKPTNDVQQQCRTLSTKDVPVRVLTRRDIAVS